tara:strand:+ start:27 stop:737 length:711 start_codon:yes stop_codon:yes gene_type:complete
MDSAALTSLTPLLDGIDKWVELAPLLPVIIVLELVLSADNAIALASISRGLNDLRLQRLSLNIGITLSLIFRVCLILAAKWILMYWQISLLAGFYLIYLCISKLRLSIIKNTNSQENVIKPLNNKYNTIISTVFLISITDLAFSIDSVTAAVAISDQLLLVITGAFIGVIALRLTSGVFIGFLDNYPRLEISGYLAVGLIGCKLLINLAFIHIQIPEWGVFSLMFILIMWGFSKKS